MAIQDFTAGQVLTAAQMDNLQANDYNQTVSTKTANYTLVAADKGTRIVMNAATDTAITVNTSLFSAGDTLFIQNINTGFCTITAGTATVSTNGTLVLGQYDSGILYFTSAGVAIWFGDNSPAIAWTPTLGVWTLGNGSTEGRYVRTGSLVNVFGQVEFGSTSVFTAASPTISLPFTAKANGNIAPLVSIMYFDTSANLRYFNAGIHASGLLNPLLTAITSGTYLVNGTNVGNTTPFTWAATDFIQFNLTYQVA